MNQLNIFNEVHIEKNNIVGDFKPSHPYFYKVGNLPVPVKLVPVGEREYSKRLDGSKTDVICGLLERTIRYRLGLLDYLAKLIKNEGEEVDSCGLEFFYCHLMGGKGLALAIGSDPERFSHMDLEQLAFETREFPVVTDSKEVKSILSEYGGRFTHKYLLNNEEAA